MEKPVAIVDVDAMDWIPVFTEQLNATYDMKPLAVDEETGVTVARIRYPAGFLNKTHNHPCAHGMYVLSGTLRTSEGDYGPGTFLWFPEGKVMWHGATPEADVEMLFITNKKFEINYL